MPLEWECVNETASTTLCTVTASTTEHLINYRDWLFVYAVIIFILGIMLWMFILSPIIKNK